MPDQATIPTPLDVAQATAPNSATILGAPITPPVGQLTPQHDPPGADALGEPGKRALDAMKQERNEARKLLAEKDAELAALKGAAEGREKEHQAALEAQRVRDEALKAANRRILQAEVRGAAKGVLTDPEDAFHYLDLDSFEVSDDGAVDTATIVARLKTLTESKPYLAAQGGQKWASADGGARTGSAPDIDAQIDEALKAGDITRSVALKRYRASMNT